MSADHLEVVKVSVDSCSFSDTNIVSESGSATLSSDRNNTADNTPDSMRECGAANPVAGDISRGVHGEPEALTATDSKQTRKKKGIWSFFRKGWKAVKGTFSSCHRNKMSPDTVSLEPDLQPADLENGSSPGPSGLNPTLDVVPVGSETTLAPDTNSLEPASALDPADSEESSVTESYSLALSSVPGSSSLASSSVRGSSDLGSTAEPGPSGLGSVYVPENQSPVSDSKQTRKKKGIWSFFQKGWKAVKGTFCCCYRNKMSPDMVSLEPEPQPADLEHGSSPGPSGLNPTQVGSETTPAPDTKSLEPVSALDPADSEESSVTESYSLALSSVPGSSGLTSSPVQGSSDLGSTAEPGPSGLGSVYVPENQSSVSVGFLKRYEVGEMLGAGVHGIVFSGTRKSDRQKVAIKFITKGYMTSFCHLPGYPELAEVAALLKMKQAPISQNIIQMYEWFEEKNMTILILEFPDPCETLFEFIFRNGDQLTEAVARDLMLQAVLAAAHCLENDVVHGDIHEHNILVNTDTLQLKMIDFGCAILLEEDVQKPGLEYNSRKKCAIEVTIRHLYGVLYKLVKGPGPHLSREILLERPVFWNMMAGFSLVPVGPGWCELAPLITMMVHN